MHRTKTRIGALAHKSALAMLFCVTGFGLTGSGGPQRSLGTQMAWDLKIAREEGLLAAIETLAGINPGKWDKNNDTIVSRWQGPNGLAIKSTFAVPSRKILEVRQGAIPLLYIDSQLDGGVSAGQNWFLPGNWMQTVMAAVRPTENNIPAQEPVDIPPPAAHPKNYG